MIYVKTLLHFAKGHVAGKSQREQDEEAAEVINNWSAAVAGENYKPSYEIRASKNVANPRPFVFLSVGNDHCVHMLHLMGKVYPESRDPDWDEVTIGFGGDFRGDFRPALRQQLGTANSIPTQRIHCVWWYH